MDRRRKLLQYKVNNTVIDIGAVAFGSFKIFPQRFRSLIWVYFSWIYKDRKWLNNFIGKWERVAVWFYYYKCNEIVLKRFNSDV